MAQRQRLLQLAPSTMAEATAGAPLRSAYLARALAHEMEVTHVGFSRTATSIRRERENAHLEVLSVPRPATYSLSRVARGLVTRTPLTVLNYTSQLMTDTLGSLLENGGFDVVQLEGVHMAGYLPLFTASASPPVLSCDWHNVESDLLERYRQAAPSPVHSLYAAATAAKLRTTERDLLRTCGLHLTCSERDRQLLRGFEATARIEVVENGVDTTYFTADESGGGDTPRDFVFVGSMDYWANAKAAIWFTEAIWPAIRRHFPEAQFLIVGRSPGERVRGLERHPGVVVTGTVEDIRPYYRRALAAVVPLQSGGGTRLKILEAMAAGVPVVSTGIGAEGLAVEPGSHYLRADSPEAFVESVRRIALDRGARERITRAAGELVRARYEWKVIGETLAECYSPAYGSRQHEKR